MLSFLARAAESWLGGFNCMSPVLLYSSSFVFHCLSLLTWLKGLGTPRKKSPLLMRKNCPQLRPGLKPLAPWIPKKLKQNVMCCCWLFVVCWLFVCLFVGSWLFGCLVVCCCLCLLSVFVVDCCLFVVVCCLFVCCWFVCCLCVVVLLLLLLLLLLFLFLFLLMLLLVVVG